MFRGLSRQIVGLKPSGQDDRGEQRTSTLLAAYFNAEDLHSFRQLLWRRLAVIAVVAWLVDTMMPLSAGDGLPMLYVALLAAAVIAAVAEWRAANTLRRLIESSGARSVEAVSNSLAGRLR